MPRGSADGSRSVSFARSWRARGSAPSHLSGEALAEQDIEQALEQAHLEFQPFRERTTTRFDRILVGAPITVDRDIPMATGGLAMLATGVVAWFVQPLPRSQRARPESAATR